MNFDHFAMCEVNFCLVCRNYIVCTCAMRNASWEPNNAIRHVKVHLPVAELEKIIASNDNALSTAVIRARKDEETIAQQVADTYRKEWDESDIDKNE